MPWFIFLVLILFVWYAWQINEYHRSWEKIPEFSSPSELPQTLVSVIIPVRNESTHISLLLSSLESQEYPKASWEVIVVDDHSEDDTVEKASAFLYSEKFRLRVIRMQELFPDPNGLTAHKKKALSAGIAQAEGRVIVTTDADCHFQKNWLFTLMHFYERTGARMIAAPVKIGPVKNGLDLFQQLDFLSMQGITGAVVHAQSHSMCNGANLCYEKSAFEEVNGFEGIDHIASGDDMLLMQKFAARFPGEIRFIKHRDAIVTTAPAPTLTAFFRQRIRWAGKTGQYKETSLFVTLALVYALNASLFTMGLLAGFDRTTGFFFLLFLLGKVLIEFPFVHSVAAFFEVQKQLKWFLLLQPFHIVYIVLAGGLGIFSSTQWKGRTIHTKGNR